LLTRAGPIDRPLQLTTGGIWPVAIAHAGLTVAWGRFDRFTAASTPAAVECLTGECGPLPLPGYTGVAARPRPRRRPPGPRRRRRRDDRRGGPMRRRPARSWGR
jgi:hypothetical protein